MSQAASQAAAFYRDVAKHRVVWTLRDDGGFPAPKLPSGQRAQPFWSSRSRVERIIAAAPAYRGFTPFAISWEAFEKDWLPGLERDGLLVGVNWSGPRARGYDMTSAEVRANVGWAMENSEKN